MLSLLDLASLILVRVSFDVSKVCTRLEELPKKRGLGRLGTRPEFVDEVLQFVDARSSMLLGAGGAKLVF